MKPVTDVSLKGQLRRCLPWVFRLAPPAVAGRLIEGRPYWVAFLRPGRTVTIRTYLGAFTVNGDVLYPIERDMLSGTYDATSLAVIRQWVRPGDVCLDIGANVGALTLALAQSAGTTGTVVALEPGPPTFRRLQRNLALNPNLAGIVSVHQIGISDRAGELSWAEDLRNRGNAGLFDQADGVKVPVITLDEFCRRQAIARLDFVKIDVEGMEYEVFHGALAVLQDLRPVFYFETLQPFADYRGFDIFGGIERLLRAYGYRLFYVERDAHLRETTAADLSANTLALPPGR